MSLLQPVETALRNSRYHCSNKVRKKQSGKKMLKWWNSRSAVGQFTISLTKVCGSLGFTLRQLDDTVLKHTIKVGLSQAHHQRGSTLIGWDKLVCQFTNIKIKVAKWVNHKTSHTFSADGIPFMVNVNVFSTKESSQNWQRAERITRLRTMPLAWTVTQTQARSQPCWVFHR